MTVRDRWDQLSKALGLGRKREGFAGDDMWRRKNFDEEVRRIKDDPKPPQWCVDCKLPECDHGCAYPETLRRHPQEDTMSTAGRGGPSAYVEERDGSFSRVEVGGKGGGSPIHDPIRPFGAPAVKPTISDAYRASAQDIATCLDRMIETCEQARQQGLALIEALNEAGDSHDDFVKNYVEIATARATTVRDTWKKQLEDLTKQTSALKNALAAQMPAATTEGEQT